MSTSDSMDFPDFDSAYRNSSIDPTTITLATAQRQQILRFASHSSNRPTLIHIRAPTPASFHSFAIQPLAVLRNPSTRAATTTTSTSSMYYARRRAQSDMTFSRPISMDVDAVVGASRPISAVLVAFLPIDWGPEAEFHPGTPATLKFQFEDNEAVSPKSRIPRAMQRMGAQVAVKLASPVEETAAERRVAGVEAAKPAVRSPYPYAVVGEQRLGRREMVIRFVSKVVKRVGRYARRDDAVIRGVAA